MVSPTHICICVRVYLSYTSATCTGNPFAGAIFTQRAKAIGGSVGFYNGTWYGGQGIIGPGAGANSGNWNTGSANQQGSNSATSDTNTTVPWPTIAAGATSTAVQTAANNFCSAVYNKAGGYFYTDRCSAELRVLGTDT
jgi:hypothetical protein